MRRKRQAMRARSDNRDIANLCHFHFSAVPPWGKCPETMRKRTPQPGYVAVWFQIRARNGACNCTATRPQVSRNGTQGSAGDDCRLGVDRALCRRLRGRVVDGGRGMSAENACAAQPLLSPPATPIVRCARSRRSAARSARQSRIFWWPATTAPSAIFCACTARQPRATRIRRWRRSSAAPSARRRISRAMLSRSQSMKATAELGIRTPETVAGRERSRTRRLPRPDRPSRRSSRPTAAGAATASSWRARARMRSPRSAA